MRQMFNHLRAYLAFRSLWTYDPVDKLYWRGPWQITAGEFDYDWFTWRLTRSGETTTLHDSLTAAMRTAAIEDSNAVERLEQTVEGYRREAERYQGQAQALDEETKNLQQDRNRLQQELDDMRRIYAGLHQSARSMAAALVKVNHVLRFDLQRMITDGPDYNAAVAYAHEAVSLAILDTPSEFFVQKEQEANAALADELLEHRLGDDSPRRRLALASGQMVSADDTINYVYKMASEIRAAMLTLPQTKDGYVKHADIMAALDYAATMKAEG